MCRSAIRQKRRCLRKIILPSGMFTLQQNVLAAATGISGAVYFKRKFCNIKNNYYLCIPHRGVEQLVARRAHNPEAGGSSPPPATTTDTEQSVSVSFIPSPLTEPRRRSPTYPKSSFHQFVRRLIVVWGIKNRHPFRGKMPAFTKCFHGNMNVRLLCW